MKQAFLAIVLLIGFRMGSQAQSNAGSNPIGKWQISTQTAGRMIMDQKNCSNCRFIKWQEKEEVKDLKKEVRQALGIASFNLRRNWKAARYNKEDEARYAANHGLPAGSEAAAVTGYTTRILRYRIPARDRRKYAVLTQNATGLYQWMQSPDVISIQCLYILHYLQTNNTDFTEQKFMYFDIGQLCPPPNGC